MRLQAYTRVYESNYPSHVITTLCRDYTFPTTCTGDGIIYVKNKKWEYNATGCKLMRALVCTWGALCGIMFFPVVLKRDLYNVVQYMYMRYYIIITVLKSM